MINLYAVQKLLLRDSAGLRRKGPNPDRKTRFLRFEFRRSGWNGEGLRSVRSYAQAWQEIGSDCAILEQAVGRLLACQLRVLRGLVVCGLDCADVFDFCWLLLTFCWLLFGSSGTCNGDRPCHCRAI